MASSGLKRHKGKLLPKKTPAEREMIAFGYPDLSQREVALKFGVSQCYVQKLRSGQYKVPLLQSPKSSRLPVAQSLAKLDLDWLVRAVPLMHNYCQRKAQLLTQGRSEISLEPLPEGDRHAKAASMTSCRFIAPTRLEGCRSWARAAAWFRRRCP